MAIASYAYSYVYINLLAITIKTTSQLPNKQFSLTSIYATEDHPDKHPRREQEECDQQVKDVVHFLFRLLNDSGLLGSWLLYHDDVSVLLLHLQSKICTFCSICQSFSIKLLRYVVYAWKLISHS